MTVFIFVLAITSVMLLSVVLAILLRRRYTAPWWLFCAGMAAFVGAQLVHLPLNDWLQELGVIPASATGNDLLQAALVLGLTAGLSETLARVITFALLFRGQHARFVQDATMVGLGHGGVEAFGLIAVIMAAQLGALWSLQGTDLSTLNLQAVQAAALQEQMAVLEAPWLSFLAVAERLIAVGIHVVLSLLVWQAFRKRNPLYALVALLYHTTFDASAVYLAQTLEATWLVEVALVLIALPGAIWGWRLWRSGPAAPRHATQPVREEWRLFASAVGKELLYQWRTYRILVVGAVFLVFGLLSPLLAKFTPQLLTTIEGAEQFAQLIPEPTTADAVSQYIKNITQFGFIIAVLLGMGAVAGEKEKGTAAVILSKPLPRWAFLLSKFVAQALVYLLGFVLAGAAAYYYTLFLFEPLAAGEFVLGNLLLLAWLLVFAAVTLLGSTLARTTAMGAGLGLAGAVALLIAGSLPRIGPFAPAGLVAWASTLGLEAVVPANPGALAAGGALVLASLIGAVAALEVQEL